MSVPVQPLGEKVPLMNMDELHFARLYMAVSSTLRRNAEAQRRSQSELPAEEPDLKRDETPQP